MNELTNNMQSFMSLGDEDEATLENNILDEESQSMQESSKKNDDFIQEEIILSEISITLLKYISILFGLNDKQIRTLNDRLKSFSFRIRQPRKDDGTCNRTPLFNRWNIGPMSHLTPEDRRYATAEECEKVYQTLLALLLEVDGINSVSQEAIYLFEEIVGRTFHYRTLNCIYTSKLISVHDIKKSLEYSTDGVGAYEAPITYKQELDEGGHHRANNVTWMVPLHINYKLRRLLKQSLASKVSAKATKNALAKILVKSYCTDKVTMPPYYSNRDIRWATWPIVQVGLKHTLQYASHYQCARIELELMAQLFEFEDAPLLPSDVIKEITDARGKPFLSESRRCFITGRPLNYNNYIEGAANPMGGRSKYHVGHIVPLTRGGKHAYDNIAWTSDDGNRIQGNDTVEEIESKLLDMVIYHMKRDAEKGHLSEQFRSRVESIRDLLNFIDTVQ